MAHEIERKFLIDKYQWEQLAKPEGKFYRQGYISKDPSKTVRVRIADDIGFITIKGKSTGASRLEYEYQIPLADAVELLDSFCDAVITKNRYHIYCGGKLWEVDEFLNENAGLLIAEIELEAENETFDVPAWVSTEVTGDKKYYNSNLSVLPYSKW